MTVGELRRRMANLELEDWRALYTYEAHQRAHAEQVRRDIAAAW